MRFPNQLKRNSRLELPENKISLKNYMFARHKPGSEWTVGDEYPDFSKIKSDQSFNWSAFSIPAWTRFNDKKEYLEDYGVIGYSVNTIRNASQIDKALPKGAYGVKHVPLDNNYAHCELYQKNISKKLKRDYRATLKHNCLKSLYPFQKVNNKTIFIDLVRMIYHRIIVWLK